MAIRIALAGNPNSGKTTLFNALTGANQFVGNWPGVTVEKKEGRLKNDKNIIITDLPGIYSLSPYSLEEVVARNYIINEKPDAILNIIDGTNLERNLYLTTQLMELGIPVVMAINFIDIVQKNGDQIDIARLSKDMGCPAIEISALKGTGVSEVIDKAIQAAEGPRPKEKNIFQGEVAHALEEIKGMLSGVSEELKLFYAAKVFERDQRIMDSLPVKPNAEPVIRQVEDELDDTAESIIINQRYEYITKIAGRCMKRKPASHVTLSDKIDRIVTNRILALPIFAAVMFLVYYISVTTIGGMATDWVNDGVFGEGWHLLGMGTAEAEEATAAYEETVGKMDAFIAAAQEQGIDTASLEEALAYDPETDGGAGETAAQTAIDTFAAEAAAVEGTYEVTDEEGAVTDTLPVSIADFQAGLTAEEPDPASYGVWVPSIPVLVENGLTAVHCADWLQSLILDAIVGGVGAVLGFVPQILVLFIFLAFLEACGYMARIAFIMDRIFRKFGLSGKSFIPMLIGTGCGVPGVMASRTIENDRDRKMTIMTTTFIPCSAKLPIIALIAGALFDGAAWVAPSAYFVGIAAIVVSGIILKKTRIFAGDPAPFVMELPPYHMPTVGAVLRSMWERGSSFIRKAGTIILASSVFIWFTSNFGIVDGSFGMVDDLSNGFLASIGNVIAPLFAPLGWGNWQFAVAAITGLVAKENVVGTLGQLYGFAEVSEDGVEFWSVLATNFTMISAYSFLVFNLLCAPCFAAMGAIRREMNNGKWTAIALGYQCGFAYLVALCINQLGNLIAYGTFGLGQVVAILVVCIFIFLMVRPDKYRGTDVIRAKVNV